MKAFVKGREESAVVTLRELGNARGIRLQPGISPGPSTATIAAPPLGTLRRNIVGGVAEDESAGRSLSADIGVSAAVGAVASDDHPLEFWNDV